MEGNNEEWVKIPQKTGVWRAEQPGDSLEGKYVKRLNEPYMGRPNCKYIMESEHPDSVEGQISFYGTQGLNHALADIPTGYMIRIEYKGEKPSKDPKKKAFKLFDVYVRISKTDPLYPKLYPTGAPETPKTARLNTNDQGELSAFIKGVEEELAAQNLPLIELNMLTEAKSQIGDEDMEFWEKARKQIRDNKYPSK